MDMDVPRGLSSSRDDGWRGKGLGVTERAMFRGIGVYGGEETSGRSIADEEVRE